MARKKKSSIPNLPQEIITEILFLLDVKSLSKCKCVSKTWVSMISSPDFVKSHLQISSKRIKEQGNETILLGYHKFVFPSIVFNTCSQDSLIKDNCLTDVKFIKLKLGRKHEEYSFRLRIVGWCNGLYCFRTHFDFILCNPSTRKSKRVLQPENWCHDDLGNRMLGFGYDICRDDYIIVASGKSYIGKHVLGAYSMKADSWKEVLALEYSSPDPKHPQRSAFVGNSLHWIVESRTRKNVALAYNLETQMVGEVMLPDDKEVASTLTLGILRGMLCLIRSFSTSVDLWVMNEYGIEESWVKTHSSSAPQLRNWRVNYIVTGSDTCNTDTLLSLGKSLGLWKGGCSVSSFHSLWCKNMALGLKDSRIGMTFSLCLKLLPTLKALLRSTQLIEAFIVHVAHKTKYVILP